MKKEITYAAEKFFDAVKTVESIPQDRATMREQIAAILQIVSGETPVSSEMIKNISLEDIEKAEEEADRIDLENPLGIGSDVNNGNILADMVFVEHVKDNLKAVRPKETSKRNLF